MSPGRVVDYPLGLRSQGPEFKSPSGRSLLTSASHCSALASGSVLTCSTLVITRVELRQDVSVDTKPRAERALVSTKLIRGDLSRRVAARERSEASTPERLGVFKSPSGCSPISRVLHCCSALALTFGPDVPNAHFVRVGLRQDVFTDCRRATSTLDATTAPRATTTSMIHNPTD